MRKKKSDVHGDNSEHSLRSESLLRRNYELDRICDLVCKAVASRCMYTYYIRTKVHTHMIIDETHICEKICQKLMTTENYQNVNVSIFSNDNDPMTHCCAETTLFCCIPLFFWIPYFISRSFSGRSYIFIIKIEK